MASLPSPPPPPADPLNDPSRSASTRAAPPSRTSRPSAPTTPSAQGSRSKPTSPPPGPVANNLSESTPYDILPPSSMSMKTDGASQSHTWKHEEGSIIDRDRISEGRGKEPSGTPTTLHPPQESKHLPTATNGVMNRTNSTNTNGKHEQQLSGKPREDYMAEEVLLSVQKDIGQTTLHSDEDSHPSPTHIGGGAVTTGKGAHVSRTASLDTKTKETNDPQSLSQRPPQPVFAKPFGSSYGGQYVTVAPVKTASHATLPPTPRQSGYSTNNDNNSAVKGTVSSSTPRSTPSTASQGSANKRREIHAPKHRIDVPLGTTVERDLREAASTSDIIPKSNYSAHQSLGMGAMGYSSIHSVPSMAAAAPSILHFPHQPVVQSGGRGEELVTSVFLDETEAVFNEVNDVKRQLIDTNAKMQKQLLALRHQYDTVQRQLAAADAQIDDQKHNELRTVSENNNRVHQMQTQIAVLTASLEHMKSQLKTVNKYHTKVASVDDCCDRATKASNNVTQQSEVIAEMHQNWASEREAMLQRIADLERLVVGGGALLDGRHHQKVANNYATATRDHYGTPNAKVASQTISSKASRQGHNESQHAANLSAIRNYVDPSMGDSNDSSTLLIVSPEPNRLSGRTAAIQHQSVKGRHVPYAMPRQPLERDFREGDDHSFFSEEQNPPHASHDKGSSRVKPEKGSLTTRHLVESPQRQRQHDGTIQSRDATGHSTKKDKKDKRRDKDDDAKPRRSRRDSGVSSSNATSATSSEIEIPIKAAAALRSDSIYSTQSRGHKDAEGRARNKQKESYEADPRQEKISSTTPSMQETQAKATRAAVNASPTARRPQEERSVASSTGIPAPTTELIAAALAERRQERLAAVEEEHRQRLLQANHDSLYGLYGKPSSQLQSRSTSDALPNGNYYLERNALVAVPDNNNREYTRGDLVQRQTAPVQAEHPQMSSPSRGMLENVTALAIHRARQMAASPPERAPQAAAYQPTQGPRQPLHTPIVQPTRQDFNANNFQSERSTVIPTATAPPQHPYYSSQMGGGRPTGAAVYQESSDTDEDRAMRPFEQQQRQGPANYNVRYGPRPEEEQYLSQERVPVQLQQQQQQRAQYGPNPTYEQRGVVATAQQLQVPRSVPLQPTHETFLTSGPATTYADSRRQRQVDVSLYQRRQLEAQEQYEASLPVVGYHAGSGGGRSRQRMPLAPDVQEALRVAEMAEGTSALPRPWAREETSGSFVYQPANYR